MSRVFYYLSLVLQILLLDLVIVIKSWLFPLRDPLGSHVLVPHALGGGLASLGAPGEEVGPGATRVEVLVLHETGVSDLLQDRPLI